MNLQDLIHNRQLTIIDARASGKFLVGNLASLVNILIIEVVVRIKNLKTLHPMVICCFLGIKSGQAVSYISSNIFEEVYNGYC